MRVFVAGAWGAVGRVLCPLLLESGHEVTGTTRSPERVEELRAAGVTPALVDVYDADALTSAVEAARPEVVIHQLTDLAGLSGPGPRDELMRRNARVRVEGTRNLIEAALAVGASRLIAQSICWLYAEGLLPHRESDPLHRPDDGSDSSSVSVRGEPVSVRGELVEPHRRPTPVRVDPLQVSSVDAVLALEAAVTGTPGIEGVVLRYGRFFGPGTGVEQAPRSAPVHVEAAAHAALLALTRGEPGIYNVAVEDGYVSAERARAQLGWSPDFRVPTLEAPVPGAQPTTEATR